MVDSDIFSDGYALDIRPSVGSNYFARVFAPRWWQPYRWLHWWLTPPKNKGRIALAKGYIRYLKLRDR